MPGPRRQRTSVARPTDVRWSLRGRAALAAGATATLALLTGTAPAKGDPTIAHPPPAALSWVRAPGAEECPAGPVVGAEVERVLGGPTLSPLAQAEMVIEGRVAPSAGGFETTLTLTLRSGAVLGTRTLASRDASCAAITREVALVVALMIDPEAALRPAAQPPADSLAAPAVPPPAPAGAPPPQALPPAQAPLPAPAPWRLHLAAGAVIGAGLLPAAGVGVRVRAAITPPRLFPLEIGAELFAPVRAAKDGQGVELTLAQAFVRACPLSGARGAWGFAACAGLDLGSVHGAGFGFSVNRAAELPVVAAALGGRLDVHLTSAVVISAGADLAIPFLRGRFFYDGAGGERREAFLTAPVAGTLDLSIGVQLP